jgi:hypothetical protein
VLAEDFIVVDVNSPSWGAIRPYVEAALRLEQNEGPSIWHGWDKQQIDTFLQRLPSPCSLLVAVWETEDAVELDGKGNAPSLDRQSMREMLILGCVCEVVAGEVRSIRTLESLQDDDLPPLEELEPGYQHAFELMRVVRKQVAPVAWGLFTDKQAWNEWIFQQGDSRDGACPRPDGACPPLHPYNKGELLTELAQQGRCVLMGSQTSHHHP